ncbi:hypothetical protein BDFB_012745 [Asbolus verrucosus]|uniref:Uncharacterized protein n=1 Tax=Asbolus verrucosus TaxID=1661398 RepID=A0A482W3D9_ASBVE|nr:hypothetical protein BDFB_012745 [Asbolus verrucosus]
MFKRPLPLRHLISDEANQAIGMLQLGLRQLEAVDTVQNVCRRCGQGRRKCITARDDRFLTLNARGNPNTAATSLLRKVHNASEARPSIKQLEIGFIK